MVPLIFFTELIRIQRGCGWDEKKILAIINQSILMESSGTVIQ